MRRETSRVSFLMCPFCVRACCLFNKQTTDSQNAKPSDGRPSRLRARSTGVRETRTRGGAFTFIGVRVPTRVARSRSLRCCARAATLQRLGRRRVPDATQRAAAWTASRRPHHEAPRNGYAARVHSLFLRFQTRSSCHRLALVPPARLHRRSILFAQILMRRDLGALEPPTERVTTFM
jgi:hypothetical protein